MCSEAIRLRVAAPRSAEVVIQVEPNLWRLLAFSAVVHTPVFVPVVVLFWEERGLDLLHVFLLQAIYALGVVVLEVPTGMISDRVGRRASLLFASAIYAGAMLFYAAGAGFLWFLAAELLLALAGALYSGADAALLYDSLAAVGRQAEYPKWEGRCRAVQLGSFSVSNVVGGFVGAWSLPATLALSAVGPAVALAIALGLREVRAPRPAEGFADGLRAYRELLGSTLRFVRKHRMVRWYVGWFAVLQGSAMWLLWLYQPYMAASGLPVWAFGLAFALYNAYAAVTSAFAHRFEEVLGERGALVALAALQIVPLGLMATFVTPWSFLFVLGQQTVRAVSRPVINGRILAHTWDDKRATVLSAASLCARLFFAVSAPVVGWASDALTLPQALWVQAALLTALVALLGVEWLRIPDKYRRVKPAPSG
jgi:predicted MFS family arabinose efflux permease